MNGIILPKIEQLPFFALIVVKKRGKMTTMISKYIDRLLKVPLQSFFLLGQGEPVKLRG